jgi:hypothetical protein
VTLLVCKVTPVALLVWPACSLTLALLCPTPPCPIAPLFPLLQACISMKPRVDMDISGSDIPCKSNQFCQVCGGLETVKNGCMQDNRCV